MYNNEYLDVFLSLDKDRGRLSYYDQRVELVKAFSWAVPNLNALETLREYAPIVEIGAGGGYWAYLLRGMGVDIKAYDKEPYVNKYVGCKWAEIETGGPETLENHSDRTLFLCWPPLGTPMAADCLKHFQGKHVIYVGEYGGATADDRFHELLEKDFKEVAYVDIPVWEGVHDMMFIYERV